jgi:hypothetical protein
MAASTTHESTPTNAVQDTAESVVTLDAPPPPRDAPAPPRNVYAILEVKPDGNATRVRIRVGKKLGVDKSWKAHLVDHEGRPVPGGELTITAVDDATTTATTRLRIDAVPKDAQARVRPY